MTHYEATKKGITMWKCMDVKISKTNNQKLFSKLM